MRYVLQRETERDRDRDRERERGGEREKMERHTGTQRHAKIETSKGVVADTGNGLLVSLAFERAMSNFEENFIFEKKTLINFLFFILNTIYTWSDRRRVRVRRYLIYIGFGVDWSRYACNIQISRLCRGKIQVICTLCSCKRYSG